MLYGIADTQFMYYLANKIIPVTDNGKIKSGIFEQFICGCVLTVDTIREIVKTIFSPAEKFLGFGVDKVQDLNIRA